MDSLFTSPRLVDFILLFTCVEALVLSVWQGAGRRREIALMLLPGIFLLLALRAAMANAFWPWLPAALGGALIAHLLDLRQRLRR